ncbi:MAG: SAM-dependent methyltransferase, partial [Thermodesulfobacteriota bacterium]|nr:SAM-dependent methyltransferase [Thermodesulfobacteriota bacterium]
MALEINLDEDEELDQLFDGRLKIIHKKEGYRFSIDAILLAHFASLIKAPSIIDLGTGSGIIPLVLARKTATPSIVGVE